jgi:hypothetical protein
VKLSKGEKVGLGIAALLACTNLYLGIGKHDPTCFTIGLFMVVGLAATATMQKAEKGSRK